MSFNAGELVKRSTISKSPKGYCVIVDKTKDNYTLYNNSLKCLQYVAVGVVEWRQKRKAFRIQSLRRELGIGIVSRFHDKPIPFKKNSK